jgi:DNA-binding NarL/FixJ family response regulator
MPIRCLIVDDSSQFALDAREVLEEEGILVVALAANSEEGLRLARDLRPDLALVDIDLGGESGLDLVRHMGAVEGGNLAGAVILVSTHAEEQFAELIAASPAVGFIAKSELSADAIERLMSRSHRERVD